MKLEIRDLHVSIEDREILKGISLVVNSGEIHALMGPNGSGKSTLSYVLAGHPKYQVTKGDILVDGKSILSMLPNERAKLGLFLAFQHPLELQGLSLSKFLFTLAKIKDRNLSFIAFKKQLDAHLSVLGVDKSFIERDVNVGFSGGEKKRAEILQLLTLHPLLVVLDEMDSGLDVDTMQVLANAIAALRNPSFSCLIITHYQRLLNYLKPDMVHIIVDGKIVASGNAQLAMDIEKKGYQKMVAV
jgi:Fe-S cluster assembly ATP-binding protein